MFSTVPFTYRITRPEGEGGGSGLARKAGGGGREWPEVILLNPRWGVCSSPA